MPQRFMIENEGPSVLLRRNARVPTLMGTAALFVLGLLLGGCGAESGSPSEAEGGNEPTNATATDAEGANEGVIDIEGGYTQDEQLAELESVVEVMREHFGDEVATIDGEPWSPELHHAEVTPRPQGDGVYRHEIRFDVAPDDLEETYATAEQIAEQLGLTENINNSHGITEYGEIFYGAGSNEGRMFLMKGSSAEAFSAVYNTRHSDDPSIQEAYDEIVTENRRKREEEFGPDNPRQIEDIEGQDDQG